MNENPRETGRRVIASIAAYEAAQDPAVSEWQAALGRSASEQLRDAQAALAASQADLTAMQAKRDQMCENGEYWCREWKLACAERDAQKLLNGELKAEAAEMRTQRDRYAEQNEVLRQEITAVMRQLAGAEQARTTKGAYAHCFCPDAEKEN